MIISRTPLRMSFVGGGSDFKEYYKQGHGSVVSTAINKYTFVSVHNQFTDNIRVSYSKTEFVNSVDDIQHDLIREALKIVGGIGKGVDIIYMSDLLPDHQGSGLGSSGTISIGALNALYAYKGQYATAETLARQACEIEIDMLKRPLGKQDQYASAYGGFNYIRFNSDESVFVNPIIITKETKRKIRNNLMLFYTNINKRADNTLTEQKENIKTKRKTLDRMVELADELANELRNNNISNFGNKLHENWMLKKTLAGKITNTEIDDWYKKAKNAGAIGGKILGSGGGGFLLIYCDEENQCNVRKSLSKLKEIDFEFEPEGSKIIYVN